MTEFPRVPLGRVARILNGGTPPSGDASMWGGDVPFVTPPDLNGLDGDELHDTARTITEDGLAHSGAAPQGSVLLSTRAPVGHIGRAASRVAFNQGCRAVVPNKEVEPRYLAYALVEARAELDARSLGTTFPELSGSSLASVSIPTPPRATQQAIADYLDRETAQIDAFTAKNEELIELLSERHRAGFLRELLEVPSAREVRLGWVLRKLDRPAAPDAPVVTAFRDGMVTSRENRRVEGFTETATQERSGYQGVAPGDVVFHGLDGFAGAVGVSDSLGQCSPVYHVCETTPIAVPSFVAMLLRALGQSGFLEASAWSVRQRSVDYRNWSTFARLRVGVPSVEHQVHAVRLLEQLAERILDATMTASNAIELARERRAALISAAVTGKIDVGVAA